jgi:hypothetical protein
MKKVREAQEVGPLQDAVGSERYDARPLREPRVTFANEKGRSRTAEVRGRATGGSGRDKGDLESRAKGRATSAERGIEDAIGRIQRLEGRLVLEDGTQQDEKVTLSNGDVRRPIASRPFACEKGRTQDAGSRPTSDEGPPLYAKSSAVGRFRRGCSAKRSAVCDGTCDPRQRGCRRQRPRPRRRQGQRQRLRATGELARHASPSD